MTNFKEITTCVLFQKFYVFSCPVQVFSKFLFDLCIWCNVVAHFTVLHVAVQSS